MPKMKTRRSAAKRFSLTASGKIKRKRMNHKHILEKKPQTAKKRNSKTDYVHPADERQVLRMLPGA